MKNLENKQLVILVVYLNIGYMKTSKEIINQINLIKKLLKFDDVEEQTNLLIRTIVIPVKYQETKVECVYPKNQDDIDLSDLEDMIKERIK